MKEIKQSNSNEPKQSVVATDCAISETTTIESHAFAQRKDIMRMVIPENVVSIGDHAFFASGIQSIRIPKSVVSIGRYAFCACENLKTIEFENGLLHIEHSAFANCGIEVLHLPDSLKTIDENTFSGCKHLKSITSIGSVTEISRYLFSRCNSLESIVIPSSIKTIKTGAFDGCMQLKNVEISTGVNKLESSVFYKCKSLTKVTIADSVKEMGDNIFNRCESLREVRLSNTLREISECAFYGCKSLQEITLPLSVKKLNYFSFAECTALEKINIEGVQKIDRAAFDGCTRLSAEMKQLPKPKKTVVAKSLLPDELWSRGYTADELASELNGNEKIHFVTMSHDDIAVTFHGGFDYDDECYLLISRQDHKFFIETDYEFDEEEEVHGNCYRASVYGENHPLFAQLKAAYEQECEENDCESVFNA